MQVLYILVCANEIFVKFINQLEKYSIMYM